MDKKFLFIGFLLVAIIVSVSAYTPPAYTQVDFVINQTYTPPNYTQVDLVLGRLPAAPGDSCTCTDGAPWEINMSDGCTLSTPCTPTAVTFVSTGNFTCNSTLNASSLTGLATGQFGFVGGQCLIYDR